MRSSVHDVEINTSQKGALTFRVALKDRFNNSIRIADKDSKKRARISVQYSSYTQPQSMKFLQCSTTPKTTGDGDVFVLNCAGAENERILFYPSINNVPLGGQEKYEVRTTLCPGRSTCEIQGNYFFLSLLLFVYALLCKSSAVEFHPFLCFSSSNGRVISAKEPRKALYFAEISFAFLLKNTVYFMTYRY